MYIVAYLTGLALGAIFFGGLYLSVRRMPKQKHPAAFMFIGTTIRMVILLSGFYLLRKEGSLVLVLTLLGVISVRIVMVRWQKRELAGEKNEEVDHEH